MEVVLPLFPFSFPLFPFSFPLFCEVCQGGKQHSRDALEFLLHDLLHMEKFVDPQTFDEQVGFFQSVLRLHDGEPQRFFDGFGGDALLWNQIEYCISDMNAWSVHLVKFLKAKFLLANKRDDRIDFVGGWAALLHEWGVNAGFLEGQALEAICQRELTPTEALAVGQFFASKRTPQRTEQTPTCTRKTPQS